MYLRPLSPPAPWPHHPSCRCRFLLRSVSQPLLYSITERAEAWQRPRAQNQKLIETEVVRART